MIDQSVVHFAVEEVPLEADLAVPDAAVGLVIFAHGSGSSRQSPRNRAVAAALNRAGLATLLVDLLNMHEVLVDSTSELLRFNIPLLSRRVIGTVDWVRKHKVLSKLPIGLFGSSTGAAAVLVAAAHRSDVVRAVVSRGGRPDLATAHLPHVKAPTLLLVGGLDSSVIATNKDAHRALTCKRHMVLVPGATHLFGEPGALDQVAAEARDWFLAKLLREATA